ncbi:MAG: alpha/beta hydrolase [Trebonia sp.]
MTSFNLEQSARELTESIAKGPPLSGVSLEQACRAVEAAQSAPISMPDVDESWVTVSSAFGDFQVRIVRPRGSAGSLPAILYLHGGGWILGSWITHDLLTRRLAVGAEAAVVFDEYSRAPEAKYPVQLEQCYAAAEWIMEQGAGGGFDITRIAVAGDSAGGNMATVLTLMAKQRGSDQFVHQSLYYPMTDADAKDSESLRRFKDGPYGSAEGLAWFWNSYLTRAESRSDVLVSPLQATLADLEGLPPTRVIVDENDVLETKARPTPTNCATPGSQPHPCVSTARSTTSCASTRCATPSRPARRSASRPPLYGELSARSSGQEARPTSPRESKEKQ